MSMKHTTFTSLTFWVVIAAITLLYARADPTGLRHRAVQQQQQQQQQRQCPSGNGFNYYSHTPYCTIPYECAVAMFEFSTPCGCGCQPIKCGGTHGACPSTHVCKKGACFLK
jgi:hypothetical protein